jgi:predicted NBD/HSP70 family sugar kinase
VPAPVDPRTGQVSESGLLRGWAGVPVPTVLGARLGVPVRVDNDANLGALAESRLGAARGAQDVVYVRVAHGVGMGVVVARSVLHGRRGAAGELGHLQMEPDGEVCRCGRQGCLETLVGASVLADRLRAEHGSLTLRDLVARAQDDPTCREVLADAGSSIGRALVVVRTLLDPEIVVVGGDLARAGDVVLDPLRQALADGGPPSDVLPVVQSQLGDQAEVRGAIVLALDAAQVTATLGVGA